MQIRTDTIVAPSTAPGRGAIAVVRLSGSNAHQLARPLCRHWPDEARRVVHTTVVDPRSGRPLDDALVTRFDAPRSYTGEPMVEFAVHGGPTTTREVVATLLDQGARLAEPGEFTQRALLNGKLDLLQAEAIGDLVDAATPAHRAVALAQLHGSLSRLVQELRDGLVHVEALLAYDVDFPEEDDGPVPRARIRAAATAVLERLERLLATTRQGDAVRDGALVVIAGAPNAGKSSLFNALLGEERAIVTEIAGTTRDAIEVRLARRPWPLRLVDTAGLRDTTDRLERMGIEVSERHIGAAHVVLACGASDAEIADAEDVVQRLGGGAPRLRVLTKADTGATAAHAIAVSAVTREGLDTLVRAIDEALDRSLGAVPDDGAVLMRARQRVALERAREELREFLAAWDAAALPATVAAVHVRAATGALDELIGVVDVEQVLDRVFRDFCVGK